MTDTIVWEPPFNADPHKGTLLGEIAGSPRQYLIEPGPGGGFRVQTRIVNEVGGGGWVPLPLTAEDIATAVAHHHNHPPEGQPDPVAVAAEIEALAEIIHEGDWMMVGGEWRWSKAPEKAKNLSRAHASAVMVAYAAGEKSVPALATVIKDAGWPHSLNGSANRLLAKAEKALRWLARNAPVDRPEAVVSDPA